MDLGRRTAEYSILIADDDAGSRDAMRQAVETGGFRTRLASSGEEAVEVVEKEAVHLILCDMYMPNLTGLDTLSIIKQIDELLPFILVSGELDDQLRRQALLANAFSVIAKPVNKHVLLSTIVRALSRFYEDLRSDPTEKDH